MEQNLENNNEEVKIDNNNPLSVRVDSEFKEMFNNIIKENGISKKQLMESMIASYVEDNVKQSREEHISFTNEINLISSSLDEVFRVLSSITEKSQDTLASSKSYYEQKLENMETKLKAVNESLAEIKERNSALEIEKTTHGLEKEKLEKDIEELKQKNASKDTEINTLNKRNIELLEEINTLRSAEKENHVLRTKIEKLNNEIDMMMSSVREKDYDIEVLNKKLTLSNESIKDIKLKYVEDIKEIELKFKQAAEIDKKAEMLNLQAKYNELQAENIKNLGIINQKSEEIFLLKSAVNEKKVKE